MLPSVSGTPRVPTPRRRHTWWRRAMVPDRCSRRPTTDFGPWWHPPELCARKAPATCSWAGRCWAPQAAK
eukprot:9508549-Lingulodinium_polyedra.AAC.1